MRVKRISAILVAIALALVAAYLAWPRASLPVPDRITAMTLYSIDGRGIEGPRPGQVTFNGYPVLGAVELNDRDQVVVLRAINRGVAEAAGSASCHWPRHALRITGAHKTMDYAICFECSNIEVFDGDSRSWVSTTPDPQSTLNDVLTDAGIELAPGMVEVP